jgi:hypothetical protein
MKIQKINVCLTFALLSAFAVKAQSIPNASFENWTMISGIQTLDQWVTTAGQPSDTISPSPSTISFDSLLSLQLKTKYVFGAGVVASIATIRYPINKNPNYFNGYYKSKRTGIGSAIIKVNLYNNTIKIGTGTLNIFDTIGNFSPFELMINYSQSLIADEAEIVFYSDNIINYALNNTLWIDKISFSDFPLSTNENFKVFDNISIYPNPVRDLLIIKLESETKATMRIINMYGQELLKSQLNVGINKLNVIKLNAGIYFVETSISGKKSVMKFIKA